MTQDFREALAAGTPLLFDGATGTELYKRGIFINRCFEEANLTNRAMILGLHKEYAAAGAEVLSTNSWAAGFYKLRGHNLQNDVYRINFEAARIAREAIAELEGSGLDREGPGADSGARGWSPAPRTARGGKWVAGSVGPLGLRLEPFGAITREEAFAAFREQIRGLADGGVDLVLLETFADVGEAAQAMRASRSICPDLPVFVCLSLNLAGELALGPSLEEAVDRLASEGADAIGLNCSVGPQPMLSAIRRVRRRVDLPVIVQPNAGLPKEVDGRTIYMSTPEYFANYTKYFLQEGVRFVGGCCGTSPEHTRAMAQTMRQFRAMSGDGRAPGTIQNEQVRPETVQHGEVRAETVQYAQVRPETVQHAAVRPEPPQPEPPQPGPEGGARGVSAGGTVPRDFSVGGGTAGGDGAPKDAETRVPFGLKSKWTAKLAKGEKVCAIELLPPMGTVPDKVLENARQAKAAGIDAINIPDGPRASSRMSTIVTAIMIEQRVGIETILHYTCRDRNLIGMQSDMLGAHAIGLRNILLITGDPPRLGEYPNATGVFDIDAIGLARMVHRLNGGMDIGGRPIGAPTALSGGVGVNPSHRDFDYEMDRFMRKIDAGAEWAVTQPVFDIGAMENFLSFMARRGLALPIIMGIWPLTSLRNAQFMNNEVPGIEIPESTLARMARAGSPQEARDEGVAIARELREAMSAEVQGFQLSAPFGKIEPALRVMGMRED